jgi:hypothetical protein
MPLSLSAPPTRRSRRPHSLKITDLAAGSAPRMSARRASSAETGGGAGAGARRVGGRGGWGTGFRCKAAAARRSAGTRLPRPATPQQLPRARVRTSEAGRRPRREASPFAPYSPTAWPAALASATSSSLIESNRSWAGSVKRRSKRGQTAVKQGSLSSFQVGMSQPREPPPARAAARSPTLAVRRVRQMGQPAPLEPTISWMQSGGWVGVQGSGCWGPQSRGCSLGGEWGCKGAGAGAHNLVDAVWGVGGGARERVLGPTISWMQSGGWVGVQGSGCWGPRFPIPAAAF